MSDATELRAAISELSAAWESTQQADCVFARRKSGHEFYAACWKNVPLLLKHLDTVPADDGDAITLDDAEEALANSSACLYESGGVLFADIEVYEIELKSRQQLRLIRRLLAAMGIAQQSGSDSGGMA